MIILVIFYALSGLVLAGLAIPMILGRVPPNGWYGFRIPMTLENPQIWYPANRYAGWWLLCLSIVLLVSTFFLLTVSGITLDQYSIAIASIALLGLGLVFFVSWRYARKLAGKSNQ